MCRNLFSPVTRFGVGGACSVLRVNRSAEDPSPLYLIEIGPPRRTAISCRCYRPRRGQVV